MPGVRGVRQPQSKQVTRELVAVRQQGAGRRGWEGERLRRFGTNEHREREVHLIGSPFLFLDTLLVGHSPAVERGRRLIISVVRVVGVLLGLVLWCGVVGEGGEDGRREDVLK